VARFIPVLATTRRPIGDIGVRPYPLTSTADPGPHGGYATQSNRARTTT
jgi:hypothetical protein